MHLPFSPAFGKVFQSLEKQRDAMPQASEKPKPYRKSRISMQTPNVQEGPLISTPSLLRSTRVEGEQVIRCSIEGLDACAADDRVELSQKNLCRHLLQIVLQSLCPGPSPAQASSGMFSVHK